MKSFCIHGHFYQPPREDPFTGVTSPEKGANPFANFNEKINAECYRPNAELGNFEALSFNLGPTLAAWLEGHDPSTYQRIVEANVQNSVWPSDVQNSVWPSDVQNSVWPGNRAANGVGNALAQAYNHTILPLATRRDKETQVAWGIADFRHRFGHHPLGMWLPEMAVDQATLEVLASQGIAFTILSPHQTQGQLDGAGPYRVRLPHGHNQNGIAVFFRDEALSNYLAFNSDLSNSARDFAENCLSGGEGLRLIATDGETFGHHHRGGERFLHDLLYQEAPKAGYEVAFLARHLQQHPPVAEVEIVDNTSWSCGHGVARWREGVAPARRATVNGSGHLRQALDRLAQEMDALYQDDVERRGADPWRLRNGYIRVVLGEIGGKAFLAQQAGRKLTEEQANRVLTLLEAQYYRQAMYTSCGFFFEDLSRLESRYVIAYAAKAIHLVREATGISLEKGFKRDLRLAVSWITEQTGEDIYEEVTSNEATS